LPIDGRQFGRALVNKGFERKDDRDHVWFHHKLNGKFTGPKTCLSHSKKEMRDIRDTLAKSIQKQLRLDTKRQLEDLANCPMSADQYIAHLKAKGICT
jgi:hypothetical protein